MTTHLTAADRRKKLLDAFAWHGATADNAIVLLDEYTDEFYEDAVREGADQVYADRVCGFQHGEPVERPEPVMRWRVEYVIIHLKNWERADIPTRLSPWDHESRHPNNELALIAVDSISHAAMYAVTEGSEG